MKYIILSLFCFIFTGAYAQKLPDYRSDRVRITQTDQNIVAELAPETSLFKAKSNLHYYWYSSNVIHDTQGGYSGRLLNGAYSTFYLSKSLKEQGNFKNGLKDGVWKNWKEDGSLLYETNWKRGIIITEKKPPIWKRLPLLHKKNKTADTVNKANNPPKK